MKTHRCTSVAELWHPLAWRLRIRRRVALHLKYRKLSCPSRAFYTRAGHNRRTGWLMNDPLALIDRASCRNVSNDVMVTSTRSKLQRTIEAFRLISGLKKMTTILVVSTLVDDSFTTASVTLSLYFDGKIFPTTRFCVGSANSFIGNVSMEQLELSFLRLRLCISYQGCT